MLKTADFDYHLPLELIAQKPFFPRDKCKLLVMDKKSGALQHRRFFEIEKYLRRGDVLVLNNSKVFKARLFGKLKSPPHPPLSKGERGGFVEIFLLREMSQTPVVWNFSRRRASVIWQVLANPGKKLKPGVRIYFSQKVQCEVVDKVNDKYLVRFNVSNKELMKWVAKHGHVPVPPYIKQEPESAEEYQTVYADKLGSVAAPTAGFHFTKNLLNKLKKKGVKICYITLHVGYGTFKPIKSEYIEEHKMEPEWVEIPKNVAGKINQAKKEGRRVIAVGTTTVRAIEGAVRACHCERPQGAWQSHTLTGLLRRSTPRNDNQLFYNGGVNLFIIPGFEFKIVDALITNFHLPKSTLLLLVSAFAGRDLIKKAYQEAIKKKYHFYSFGDAMLIL
ncbi:MAG: tRNA preQ1(34) S-adenosylmethionine ribosyltransferase-isomerase QueA [bacterium]|nr:tRNA preQ1(34) S-adenosylmethionine ribosyltransferase-isomerase QueA [bacterium]